MSVSGQPSLSRTACYVMLVVACLGWFFGGMQIMINNLALRSAGLDLMDQVGTLGLEQHKAFSNAESLSADDQATLDGWNALAAKWYAWYQCAFLFGAAAGGYLFGRLGDRIGRKRAMAITLIWFGALSGISYFAASPGQLLLLRFLTCIGVGGTWPNGVALVSEAWSKAKRPLVASMIGMSGNVGIFAMAKLGSHYEITPDSWRWVMLVGATPIVLGVFVLLFVSESPAWNAMRSDGSSNETEKPPGAFEIFRKPYGAATAIGVALATIPLFGGWGSANWMMPWADEVGEQIGKNDLKGLVGQARSITSIIGSLVAGWIAVLVGRRRTYLLTSLGALAVAQYAFWMLTPRDGSFLVWVAVLGFFNGVYFGWLPFFLPELFPSRLRSTGTGVSFNGGRIFTAATLFLSGAVIHLFDGDYAKIGRATSLIFALGVIVILITPDTSKSELRTESEAES